MDKISESTLKAKSGTSRNSADHPRTNVETSPSSGVLRSKYELPIGSAPTSADANTNTDTNQPMIRISNDGSGRWTIMQGFTWIPESKKIYTAWDDRSSGKTAVVIMRHNAHGDFELKSADVSSLINHGQDLGHAYYDGKLYLFSSNPLGPGITVFTPPTVDGGQIGNVRQFNLLPNSHWGLMTTGESADAQSIVTYTWNSSKTVDPQYLHMFDFKRLMDGADGDRFDEYIKQINISPRDEYWSRKRNTIQSVTSDSSNIVVLTSADRVTDPKFLSAFDILTGKRIWRRQLTVGQEIAKSRGSISEYEGMAWIPCTRGVSCKSLWTGVRMRTSARTGNEMLIMPIPKRAFSSDQHD